MSIQRLLSGPAEDKSIGLLKVLLVFGTRPEAIKLAPLIGELRGRPSIETMICVTGQHRQMLDQVLDAFELRPDHDLDIMRPHQSLLEVTTRALEAVASVLERERPGLVVVQGDTTSAMAGALATYYARIPVAHVEAGLRTGNKYNPFPEEVNRMLVDVVSDLHFAPTEDNRQNLIREGIGAGSITVTGNTVVDAVLRTADRVRSVVAAAGPDAPLLAGIPKDLRARLATETDDRRLLLVTGHRRESFGPDLEAICLALRDIAARRPEVDIAYPVHMNPNVQEPVHRILGGLERVHLFAPPGYPAFVWLLEHSHIVLTDSGGIQEEAPSLDKPVLIARRETERPEAVRAGCARLVGVERESIVTETERLLTDSAAHTCMSSAANPYGDGRASTRIANAIEAWMAAGE